MAPIIATPPKPLKILTLDGGGLQAISTLLILDKLLDTIAKANGVPHKKPRPCDVFDTIAGIGAGGWLALLLGRFHMDITACLSEWYNITQCITPRSKSEEVRMRLFHHCYFDPDRLVGQIDHLTKVYGTGDCLFESNPDGARTRHVFVAALKSDAKGYNLFRTYEIPKGAKLPDKLLEGPKDPASFKISRAFGVTGAAKYFTPPWKEQMANGGKMRFSDTKFPDPHNITELALDEMWGIYGTKVPLSVVVNIGPGLPNDSDVKQIARRFSWGLPSVALPEPANPKRPLSPVSEDEGQNKKRAPSSPKDEVINSKHLSVRFNESTIKPDAPPTPSAEGDRKRSLARTTTFGSDADIGIEVKLRRLESEIEKAIKKKLTNLYPDKPLLYYRLAPDKAPMGTAQNDASAAGKAVDATLDYLNDPVVVIRIDDVVERMPEACAAA